MQYSKTQPYLAKIKERFQLSLPGSKKDTHHIVIDLEDSGITYAVGDSIAIFPENHPDVVAKTLEILKADPDAVVVDKKTGESFTLLQFLQTKANLRKINKKLADFAECSEMTKEELEQCEVWDFLESFAKKIPTPQELTELVMPLLPRFYSIASSPLLYPHEIHLTVAPVHYMTRGQLRYGVATDFLCYQTKVNETRFGVYIQPHHGFTLPESLTTDIIMVGPGTGVAPFRAFLQERAALRSEARHWLFFGEWNRSTDFFYEEDWRALSTQIDLQVEGAFSRDQAEKVYVQHLLKNHSKDLFRLLEKGAVFYVCGDAGQMAKDVDHALHEIVRENYSTDEDAVRDYIKKLRAEKRYLRDVY